MPTPPNERGKGFQGKWNRLEWYTDKEPILNPAERARIYDKLRKQGLDNEKSRNRKGPTSDDSAQPRPDPDPSTEETGS